MKDEKIKRDYTGERYGLLTVVAFAGRANDGHSKWLCHCECGKHTVVQSNNLKSAKSCGCMRSAPLLTADAIGNRYGKLVVLEQKRYNSSAEYNWRCRCDCGREKVVRSGDLLYGRVTSCGCDRPKKAKKHWDSAGKNNPAYTHGDATREHRSRLYSIYNDMKRRCLKPNNKSYYLYGGRGISVCEEWVASYTHFRDWALANGYSESLTLDRIDPNGNYCPENCRWADTNTQANNRRNNHIVTIDGAPMSLAQACRMLNLPYDIIRSRIVRGWQEEEALYIPVGTTRRGYYAAKNSL